MIVETVEAERPVRRASSARLVVPKAVNSRTTRTRFASRPGLSRPTRPILCGIGSVCQVTTKPQHECAVTSARLVRHRSNYQRFAFLLPDGLKSRHGSARRPGHGGRAVGTLTSGITGNCRRDGFFFPYVNATVARPFGWVSPNDQIGWSPFGAVRITRIRESLRYACPW